MSWKAPMLDGDHQHQTSLEDGRRMRIIDRDPKTILDMDTDGAADWRMKEPSSVLDVQQSVGGLPRFRYRPDDEDLDREPPPATDPKSRVPSIFLPTEQRKREEDSRKRKSEAEADANSKKGKSDSKAELMLQQQAANKHLRELLKSKPRYTLDPSVRAQLEKQFAHLRRPPLPPDLLKKGDPLQVFFQDADYVTENGAAVIRIIGITEAGNSVALRVRNFQPYFYALVPRGREDVYRFSNGKTCEVALKGLQSRLDNYLNNHHNGRNADSQRVRYIEHMELVDRLPLYRHQTKTRMYIKITTCEPRFVPWCKEALGNGLVDNVHYGIGEADIPFVLRFLVNKEGTGCGWFSVDPKRSAVVRQGRFSRCQLELDTTESAVVALPDKADVPPLRFWSWDIECAGDKGFPVATRNPVICMSGILYKIQDKDKPMNKACFCVGETDLSPDISKIQCGVGEPNKYVDQDAYRRQLQLAMYMYPDFATNEKERHQMEEEAARGLERNWDLESEAQMLLAMREYLVEYADPDFTVGYNIGGFDYPYCFDRADHLGIGGTFRDMSRSLHEMCHVKDQIFESAAFGRRTNHQLKCFGRHMFDVMLCAVRDIMLRLRIYNLNSVAFAVLKKTKHEVDHKDIAPGWLGVHANARTRKRIAEYCVNDSLITYEVLEKKSYYWTAQELARCSGVPLDYILYRGQSIKSISKILRESAKDGIVVPTFLNMPEKLRMGGFANNANADYADDLPTSLHKQDEPMQVEMTREQLVEQIARSARKPLLRENDVAIIMNSSAESIDICKRTGHWTTTSANNDRHIQQAIVNARLRDGQVYLFFTQHAVTTGKDQQRGFHGYAKLKLDVAPQPPRYALDWVSQTPCNTKLPSTAFNRADCTPLSTGDANTLVECCNDLLYGKMKKRKREDTDELGGLEDDDINAQEISYSGAIVIDPIRGLYLVPVATLDFSSLYPSVMISRNLCYTTWLSKRQALRDFKPDQYDITPEGHYFLKSSVKMGMLTRILSTYLRARGIAKKELEKEPDPMRQKVLDGRQNALKISANSVYGFTGATVGSLPCMPIAAGTTSYGREALELVQEKTEREFPLQKRFCYGPTPRDWKTMGQKMPQGVPEDAMELEDLKTDEQKAVWKKAGEELTTDGMRPIIIAGDTDSVMVIYPHCIEVADAFFLLNENAKWINTNFFKDLPPMSLAPEKIYNPGVWINRKRYAAVYWSEKTFKAKGTYDKLDAKGIETVRRDNCEMVSQQMDRLLRKILMERDVVGAMVDVASTIAAVRQDRIDPGLLVITKALSKDPKDYDPPQIHSRLAMEMERRDPLTAPHCGDRVPFVMIERGQKAKTSEKGENPVYMMQNNIPIDKDYYLENQLRKPVCRILDVIVPGAGKMLFESKPINPNPKVNSTITSFFGNRAKATEEEMRRAQHAGEKRSQKQEEEEEKHRTCSSWPPSNLTLEWARKRSRIDLHKIKEAIESRHGTNISMRRKYNPNNPFVREDGFKVKIVYKCSRCEGQVPDDVALRVCAICHPAEKCDCEENQRSGAPLLCDRCSKAATSSAPVVKTLKDTRKRYEDSKKANKDAWDTCLKCMSTKDIEDVEGCSNTSCKNWYKRLKTRLDLGEDTQQLDRLSFCCDAHSLLSVACSEKKPTV